MSKNQKIVMWICVGILCIGAFIGAWFLYRHFVRKEFTPINDLREPNKHVEKEETPETCFKIVSGVITDYDYDCGKEVVIPDTINGEKVIELGERVFEEMGIKKVIFKTTALKTIGYYTFYKNALEEVIIPDTVTKIAGGAFSDCNLTKITIPKGVTQLDEWAFSSNDIISVTFEEGINLSKIGYSSFQENKLRKITIPESVVVIENNAFANNSLTEVDLGKVETIESGVFCRNDLTNITLPNTLKFIGGAAFEFNDFETITIPSNVMTIEGEAFGENDLREVIIKGKKSEKDFKSIGTGIYGWSSIWGFSDGYNIENNLKFES